LQEIERYKDRVVNDAKTFTAKFKENVRIGLKFITVKHKYFIS